MVSFGMCCFFCERRNRIRYIGIDFGLANMGIAPFNIVSAVSLIIAQRLGRRLHDCKVIGDYDPEVLTKAGFS
jgi:hypothetical protein